MRAGRPCSPVGILHTLNREHGLHHARESGKAPATALKYHSPLEGESARGEARLRAGGGPTQRPVSETQQRINRHYNDIIMVLYLPKEASLPDIALRGIPEPLHRELKSSASRNHRSLNGEILARLAKSVSPEPVDPQALLDRIRRRNRTLGPVDLSEGTLREMRNTGRT